MNIRQNKIVYEILMDEFDAHRTKVSAKIMAMGTESERDTAYWAFVMYQKEMLALDQEGLAKYIKRRGWGKYYPRTMELLDGYGNLYSYTIEIG